jgi:hypothetical protein
MSSMCKHCPRWQGTKHSDTGMCNSIILHLHPEIRELSSPFEYKQIGTTFDPHDFYTYYYRNNRLLRDIKKAELPWGVFRMDVYKPSLTFIYNKDGEIIGERVSKVWIPIFFTHEHYGCPCMFL